MLLPGTENGRDPFFSPDGQWIGFFVSDQLKKISVQGGAPMALGGTSGIAPVGANWGRDETSSQEWHLCSRYRGFQPQGAICNR